MEKIPEYRIVEVNYPGQFRKQYHIKVKQKVLGFISRWLWVKEEADWDDDAGAFYMKYFESEEAAHEFMKAGKYNLES